MKIDWEKEHAENLSNAGGGADLPRYALIGGLLSDLPEGSSVLDVGCGSGTLRAYLKDVAYTGLDLSPTAVNKAKLQWPDDEFICENAELWHSSRQWDAVVLNEVLYYFDDPKAALKKFAALGKRLVVSTYLAKTFPWQKNPNREVAKLVRAFVADYQCNNSITLGLSRNFYQWEIAFGTP